MKMHKTLTLVVPSYNMEAYLPRCIGSLGIDRLKEVHCHDEESLADRLDVLIVNDGSTDKTSEVAHGLEERYSGIVRVIDKKNGHYGSCVNCGLDEASGTFIKILDADDTFNTEAFESYMRFLVNECESNDGGEIDLVFSDFQKVTFDGNPCEERGSFPHLGKDVYSIEVLSRCGQFLMPAVAYRTERLRQSNYRQTEGALYSDTMWTVTPLCLVRKLRYIPVLLYLYYLGREGQSMDPTVVHANIAHLVKTRKDIVVQVARQNKYASDINKGIVRDLEQKYLVNLYIMFFLKYATDNTISLLREMDEELAVLDADMYARLRSVTLPSRRGFHYIRFWQDHKWANRLVGWFLRCYSPLAQMLGRLR